MQIRLLHIHVTRSWDQPQSTWGREFFPMLAARNIFDTLTGADNAPFVQNRCKQQICRPRRPSLQLRNFEMSSSELLSSTSDVSTCCFLSIPLELRLVIYEMVYPNGAQKEFDLSAEVSTSKGLMRLGPMPNVYQEAVSVLYARVGFWFDCALIFNHDLPLSQHLCASAVPHYDHDARPKFLASRS